jgi:CRISPR-associated protein Csb2
VALGWGVDLVVGCAQRISSAELHELPGDRWLPMASSSSNNTPLRTPIRGTLAALQQRHDAFLDRVGPLGFVPVEPLTQFAITPYRGPSDFIRRPYAVFELRHDDGSFCSYPQRKLMHIAGMMRHIAKAAMLRSPPPGAGEDWVERYVVGHRSKTAEAHRQFSYLPLPSIGHEYADHAVRRVMIAAPAGDDELLEHLSARLAGRQLKPERGDEFGEQGPPTLIRVSDDNVAQRYTAEANRWATVTPVILPGHDDRKPAKTRKLIDAALSQSGIDEACTYEWSAFSRFRNSLSAHKFDRNKRPIYLKPRYLQHLTSVHLTLTFKSAMKIPGPLVIGAGRHIGFGVMARLET